MHKHQKYKSVYVYINVLQKIGHETSSEALRLSGKKSSYKNTEAIYQLSVIHHATYHLVMLMVTHDRSGYST